MDYTELSEELCQMHIRYAGVMNRMQNALFSKGEDGLLIWLDTRKEKIVSRDIANHFQLTTGRVANMLKSLEKKGMILRSQSPVDLRRVYVELTPQGRIYSRELYRQMIGKHKDMLELIGEREAMSLLETMEHILQLIEKRKIEV